MKLTDDVSYLFIMGQVLFFCFLIALIVFIAISDRRACKRLDEEEKEQAANDSEHTSQ